MSEPKCFISYSWDSDQHKDWVRRLASELQGKGVVVYLDQWDVHPGADLTGYMERSIRESDYVLLVCTPVFAQKANNRKGGVGYEQAVVTGEIFEGVTSPKKFVPILRSGDQQQSLPSYLKSRVFIDFRDDNNLVNNLELLLRHIHESPKYVRPPLGAKPIFESQVITEGLEEATIEPSVVTKSQRPFKPFPVEKVKELREFAFSSSGLDKSQEGAKQWALNNVERFADVDIGKFVSTFKELQSFAFSSSGLDMSKEQSIKWAEERVERFIDTGVKHFTERFSELYNFAFSSTGLDMSKQGSVAWALEKVSQEYDADQLKTTTPSNPNHPLKKAGSLPQSTRTRVAWAVLGIVILIAWVVFVTLRYTGHI